MPTAKSRSTWGSVGGLMQKVLFGGGWGNPCGKCGLVADVGTEIMCHPLILTAVCSGPKAQGQPRC